MHLTSLTTALATAVALLLSACASLPEGVVRLPSHAIADTSGTRLGAALQPIVRQHSGESGLVPVPEGHEAFAVRLLLAQAADQSIDVQTYIWHDDATGLLMFEQMQLAARRGVRVRLLLDDQNTVGLDPLLAMLAAEPNLQLRLFNPFVQRNRRLLGFATDFTRLNRRMHNKSFTVDNQISVVGGRNIGDEYFDASETGNFVDNEVMAVGKTPTDVSAVFDAYWNSASAYPATLMLTGVAPMTAQEFTDKLTQVRTGVRAQPYEAAVRQSQLVNAMLAGKVAGEWAKTTLVADDPEKITRPYDDKSVQMLPRLLAALGAPTQELDLVSPYFVPSEQTLATLTDLAHRGVRVRVLTNSLAATDVIPVHAGYAKHRETLLRGGVRLFELKPTAAPAQRSDSPATSGSGLPGKSGSSLHAKNFQVDHLRAFAGSFNLDPRSEKLNTEMGLVMQSPALASAMARVLDERLPLAAYEVKLADDGGLQWVSTNEPTYDAEPHTSAWRRFVDRVAGWFPFLDWML